MNVRSAIKSMRLRALPLSWAGILLAAFLSAADYHINPLTALLLLLTASALQILSNLSNVLGDALSGTDSADREGMIYGLQDGTLTIQDIKKLIAGSVVASIVSGLGMIWCAFGTLWCMESIMFMLLGVAAITAAMRYTLGRNPYGYRGLGDLYVFLFFGLATVMGGYFICAGELPGLLVALPASAIGFFSVGVLNVNNTRDMKTDMLTRRTVAIRLGAKGARIYQTVLICLGWAAMLTYCALRIFDPWHYLFVLSLPLFVRHLYVVWTRDGHELDGQVAFLSISSLVFCLLAGIGFVVYLF